MTNSLLKVLGVTFALGVSSVSASTDVASCGFQVASPSGGPVEGELQIRSMARDVLEGEVRIGDQVRILSNEVLIRSWRKVEIPALLESTTAGIVAEHLELQGAEIEAAMTYEIDPRGNAEDANGALLVVFFGSRGEMIAKGAQIGWGVVSCLR